MHGSVLISDNRCASSACLLSLPRQRAEEMPRTNQALSQDPRQIWFATATAVELCDKSLPALDAKGDSDFVPAIKIMTTSISFEKADLTINSRQ